MNLWQMFHMEPQLSKHQLRCGIKRQEVLHFLTSEVFQWHGIRLLRQVLALLSSRRCILSYNW